MKLSTHGAHTSTVGCRFGLEQRNMKTDMKRLTQSVVLFCVLVMSFTARAETAGEGQFAITSLFSIGWGVLLFFAIIGFTLFEAGAARTKNVTVICIRKIAMYTVACVAFYLIGSNFMFTDVNGGFFGSFAFLQSASPEEIAVLGGHAPETIATDIGEARSTMSSWFVYMMFTALAVSIVSGSISERLQLWSSLIFAVVSGALIFPIIGAWIWGGGWLHVDGFQDFAGATVVHAAAGWCALTGAAIMGVRSGKFQATGVVNPIPPSNVPLVALGVLFIWISWFAYSCVNGFTDSGVSNSLSLSNIITNTNLSACAGFLIALMISIPLFGRLSVIACFNGALAGLVAISAGPDFADHHVALLIGAVAGGLCLLSMKLIERMKIDDELGAVSAHLVSGVWGTLAVCLTNSDADLIVQLIGIFAVAFFASVSSAVVWFALKSTLGARVPSRTEILGQDLELSGVEAYPEFILMPEEEDIRLAE